MADGTVRLPVTRPRQPSPKRTLGRTTKETLRIGALLYPEAVEKPRTRGECPETRPCGFVSCRHNLWCDLTKRGSIALRDARVEPCDVGDSCSLDLALRGGMTMEETGRAMSITRERVRQIEQVALAKFAVAALRLQL